MLVPKTASCLNMLQWFEQNHQTVTEPRPGDIVFFKYSTNARRTNHVGIIFQVKSADSFSTIEGNTSVNSNDNGGSVMIRQRTRKNVVAFARPKYGAGQLNRVLAIAEGEVGIKEYPPNSNNVKYNTWFYGRAVHDGDRPNAKYPWCAAFVSYIFAQLDTNTLPAPKPTIPNKPTVRRGSKGEYVTLLQELLSVNGYILKVDGDFGPTTEKTVKAFQQANGLTVDGIVGPKTWEALTK